MFVIATAMEPAAERQEYSPAAWRLSTSSMVPQWSPPSKDGSTYMRRGPSWVCRMPQWSPLVNGGFTNAIFTALDALWEPQWSPPLSGGSTPLDDPVSHQVFGIAMEPAVRRRGAQG